MKIDEMKNQHGHNLQLYKHCIAKNKNAFHTLDHFLSSCNNKFTKKAAESKRVKLTALLNLNTHSLYGIGNICYFCWRCFHSILFAIIILLVIFAQLYKNKCAQHQLKDFQPIIMKSV